MVKINFEFEIFHFNNSVEFSRFKLLSFVKSTD